MITESAHFAVNVRKSASAFTRIIIDCLLIIAFYSRFYLPSWEQVHIPYPLAPPFESTIFLFFLVGYVIVPWRVYTTQLSKVCQNAIFLGIPSSTNQYRSFPRINFHTNPWIHLCLIIPITLDLTTKAVFGGMNLLPRVRSFTEDGRWERRIRSTSAWHVSQKNKFQ